MNKAIQLAIEKGGWNPDIPKYLKYLKRSDGYKVDLYNNPEWVAQHSDFWQALGKALGWKGFQEQFIGYDGLDHPLYDKQRTWQYHAHRYLDIKLTGGDEEKFWKELIK